MRHQFIFCALAQRKTKVQLFVRFLDASYVALGSDKRRKYICKRHGTTRGCSVTAQLPGFSAIMLYADLNQLLNTPWQ